jgi:hypothetical protein
LAGAANQFPLVVVVSGFCAIAMTRGKKPSATGHNSAGTAASPVLIDRSISYHIYLNPSMVRCTLPDSAGDNRG